MPLFMASIKFSAASTKAVVEKPHDRRPAARAALEAAGCTLKEYYFALGPADVVVTYEAPDAITAASVSMMLGASGASSSVETIQLFTMEEAMTAMRKAGEVQKTYKQKSLRCGVPSQCARFMGENSGLGEGRADALMA
jgi:uncharacterized protein with GYD domain